MTQSGPDQEGAVVVPLVGELDIAVADDVRRRGLAALDTDGIDALVLGLADVTFLDSSAIGALVEIRNAAHAAGIPVHLRGVSSSILRTIEIMGLSDLFVIDAPDTRANG